VRSGGTLIVEGFMTVASGTRPPTGLRRPAPPGSLVPLRVAWVVTVLVSTVPVIVLTELTGSAPGWVAVAQLAIAATLLGTSLLVPAWRPLRGLGVVLVALPLLLHGASWVDLTFQPMQDLLGASAFDGRMQAEQLTKLVLALLMVGILLMLGYGRRDLFLARGDLRAPISPVRWLGFPHPDPWWRFGLQWGFYVAAGLALVLYLVQRPSGQLSAVLPMVPSILFYAALNAFNEEMTYRAPLLATLEPAVGSTQAVWMAALLFGSAHYYGMGLAGAVLSVFMGWLLGKAMVETRGLFWAWWIHFLSDVAIFTFLAMTLV
jgi:hypothetical protein